MGVAKDNPIPTVPDTVLAKFVAASEARLRRKREVKLIPLVPRKRSAEVIKKVSASTLKKQPLAPFSQSAQSQASSSRPGTPTSQNSDSQTQRQPNKLRKRSRSFTRSSPRPGQQSLPVQPPLSPVARVQKLLTKDGDQDKESESEVVRHKQTARVRLGPPPSPSHGKRFEVAGAPKRRPKRDNPMHPSHLGPPPPSPPMKLKPFIKDWEIV